MNTLETFSFRFSPGLAVSTEGDWIVRGGNVLNTEPRWCPIGVLLKGELLAEAVQLLGPLLGVSNKVLPVENNIVSLADESAVLDIQSFPKFNDGENGKVGTFGRF